MFARITRKLVCSSSVLLLALAVTGCGKGGSSDGKGNVSGKVTQGGQVVAGETDAERGDAGAAVEAHPFFHHGWRPDEIRFQTELGRYMLPGLIAFALVP